MKSILFVTELYHPSIGGQEVRFKELAEELAGRGYEVSVITIDHQGNLQETEYINGVLVHRIYKNSHYIKKGGGRSIKAILIFTMRLIKYCRDQKYDFIYINQWPVLPALTSFLYVKNTNYRVDFVEFRGALLWRAINIILSLTNHNKFIFISESVAARMSTDEKLVIPSLVKLDRYSCEQKDKMIFVGRLEKHKRPHLAIDSFILWAKNNKQYTFHVVGDGELLGSLKEKYKNYKSVLFHGFLSDREKNALLSHSKIFILPSEREGLPKTVIEAIASMTPVITTDDDGNFTKYFVNDKKVGLVSKADTRSISNAIESIIEDYEYYQQRCKIIRPEHNLFSAVDKIERMINEQA